MNIVFRVDASSVIGTGHVMRCLTLANALLIEGARSLFICRHMPDHLQKMLRDQEHDLALLPALPFEVTDDLDHSEWLGTSQEEDSQATLRILDCRVWEWMIVDHYALDARWEKCMRSKVRRIMVIDDIADRVHDCDVLLDQNLYTNMELRYADKAPLNCSFLLGPRYALLRDEFRELHGQFRNRTLPIKRVLVFLGGVDFNNYTKLVIEALAGIVPRSFQTDVVIGMQHPAIREIEVLCFSHNFSCHIQTQKMAELMSAADLAIGAGGSANWERCCLGLPAFLISLAENQVQIAQALDLFGAVRYLGREELVSVELIQNEIINLLNDADKFSNFSKKSYSLVDGLGAERVANTLLN